MSSNPHFRSLEWNASSDGLFWRVQDKLEEVCFPPDACPTSFVPRGTITAIADRNTIIQELWPPGEDLTDEDNDLVEWIRMHASSLFLIMVYSRVPGIDPCSFMKLFQKLELRDDQLPLTDQAKLLRIPSTGNEEEPFPNIWDKAMKLCFQRSQWMFAVPVISPDQFNYHLQRQQILPFTSVHRDVKEGAFGRVYRVKIHPSHIYPVDHQRGEIAVKQIISGSKEEQRAIDDAWPNEVRALKIIKDRKNAHLIHCIAAIERGRSRYLLFPWAEGGNLKEYWEKNPRQAPNEANIKEALAQLKGLASALRCLHYFSHADDGEDPADVIMEDPSELDVNGIMGEYGRMAQDGSIRHGDLKPENLLWFLDAQKRRCLKIADLGLAKRHVIATQDRSKPTTTRHGTVLYEAPEAQTAVGNQPRSRQYDIWSMGCITLEWVIWILYGNDELKRFYDDLKGSGRDCGPYYILNTAGQGPTLHPAVVHWISSIRKQHPICQRDSAINDLLKLVQERLLVVQLPPRRPTTLQNHRARGIQSDLPNMTSDGAVSYRATSIDLEKAIDKILDKVQMANEYLLTSADLESTNDLLGFKPSLHPDAARHGATRGQQRDLAPPTPSARNVRS